MPSVLAAPRVGSQVLGTLKYLCFIPEMSSELFRALTSAATVRAPPGRKKPMPHSTYLESPAAKMAARQSGQKARAGVHARRNNTALNTATSPFPLVWHFHTAKKPSNQS